MFRLVYVYIILGLAKSGFADVESCITVDGQTGRCIRVPDCQSIYNVLEQHPLPFTQTAKEYLRQSLCGFSGKTPKVCCSDWTTGKLYTDFSKHKNVYLLKKDICGRSIQGRIIHGTEAQMNQFPWMVLLDYGKELDCGGTIINERYILTAAHCINSKVRKVRIGEHSISNEIECQSIMDERFCAPPLQEIAIEKIIVHELYNSRSVTNDIALIRVASPIDLTVDNASPICLPLYENLLNINLIGKNLTVAGWGLTEKRKRSDVLLYAAVNVISNKECEERYIAEHTPSFITSKKMCAGTAEWDSCNGDSGGPLMYVGIYNNSFSYIQQGIISYGSWACGKGTPGVYVRLIDYVKWILDHIKP